MHFNIRDGNDAFAQPVVFVESDDRRYVAEGNQDTRVALGAFVVLLTKVPHGRNDRISTVGRDRAKRPYSGRDVRP